MNLILQQVLLALIALGGDGTSPDSETPDSGTMVTLNGRLSHPCLLAGKSRETYLCLTLAGSEPAEVRRLGMNLALVIDRSGSMASENKLDFAKSAAEQLVDRLRPDDHLSIVAYDDRIQTLVPSMPARNRNIFREAIQSLHSGNSTNLCGGMVAGYEEVLGHYDEARLNRVVLISDGLANVGITTPRDIWTRARRCREHGVRISTMGVGVDYDEVLMSNISEHSGGNYYYIDHAEAIGRYLEKELDELCRVVARNLVVTVRLGQGVDVLDVFGYLHEQRGSILNIPVSDMFSGEGRKIVMRLRLTPGLRTELPVAAAAVRYKDAATSALHVARTPVLSTRFTSNVEQVIQHRDMEVLTKVEIVRNAEALNDAMQHQKQGEIELARNLLVERYLASKARNDAEYHSEEIARLLARMDQVTHELTRTRHDPTARRDLQLRTQLRALGYLGRDD